MGNQQFGITPKQINSLVYTGPDLALTPVTEGERDPGASDKNYPIDCFWRNTVTRVLFWLSGFNSSGALWVNISSSGAGLLSTLSDTANTQVSPAPGSNIQLNSLSGNLLIVSDPGGIKIDFSIANAVSGTYQFNLRVAAFCSTANGGPLSAGYEIVYCCRTTGAASSIIGTPEKVINEEGALSVGNVTIVASANNMIVRVLGTAAKTVNWKAELTYTFVS